MKYQEWKDILQKGVDGNLTDDDKESMNTQCSDWNFCAVGAKFMCDLKLDSMNTANESVVETINEKAWGLGNGQFPHAIWDKDYKEALVVLDKIYNMKNIYKTSEAKQKLLEAELAS